MPLPAWSEDSHNRWESALSTGPVDGAAHELSLPDCVAGIPEALGQKGLLKAGVALPVFGVAA